MSLQTGMRLGPYEVVGAIGEGGMGEVYRAKDTRLGRDVALKVLPAALAEDSGRRARFEREAQVVATLSHPNIVSLFDTGAHDGRLFVVMELLEGETLRDRLAKGSLPIRKAVEIAMHIARGLSAAHEKGLVHRDLKPANIFLVGDGQVKILDFGLARQAALADISETRTADDMTDPGTVMGTVGYMAPEQVRGENVDARCDLFAFGAVLYEMLSGRRAFQRDTAAETMTAILREDPLDLADSRSGMPPALERIVSHCLEKNPIERFQTARDIAFALDSLSASGTGSGAAAPAPRTGSRGLARWLGISAAAALGVIAGAIGAGLFEPPPESIEFITKTFDESIVGNARFLPDGRSIVYSASINGQPQSLYELSGSSVTPRPFGPASTRLLAVSKTGELAVLMGAGDRYGMEAWVNPGTLAKMTLDAAPRPIASGVSAADWSPDGQQLAIVKHVDGLAQLEYPIGRVLYKTAGYISDIRVSPDGRHVLFMDHQAPTDNRGWLKIVDATGKVTTLAGEFEAEAGVAWSMDGRGVFYSLIDSTEPSFDIRRLEVGRPSSVSRRSAVPSSASMTILDASPDGSLLTMSDRSRTEVGVKLRREAALRDQSWLDRSWGPSLSADGSLLLFTHGHSGPNYGAALRRTDGSPVIQLGPGGTMGISPDGRWAIAALTKAPAQLLAYPTGAAEPVVLPRGPIEVYDADMGSELWLPNSSKFLFRGSEPGRPSRTYIQGVDGGDPKAVLPESARAVLVSSDGDSVVAMEPGQPWRLYRLDGGSPPLPLLGLTASDRPAGWTEDRRAIIIVAAGSLPVRLERVDLRTGARAPLREIAPPSRASRGMTLRSVTADGDQFAYTAGLSSTTLHVVTGVRGVK